MLVSGEVVVGRVGLHEGRIGIRNVVAIQSSNRIPAVLAKFIKFVECLLALCDYIVDP